MEHFTPVPSLLGGLVLGLGALLLFAFNGRIAGISGIASGALWGPRGERSWRLFFLAGLALGSVAWLLLDRRAFGVSPVGPVGLTAAGLLVGAGTALANGCTSGHGVVGLSRRSPRSLAAVVTFMSTAALVVFVVRHAAVRA